MSATKLKELFSTYILQIELGISSLQKKVISKGSCRHGFNVTIKLQLEVAADLGFLKQRKNFNFQFHFCFSGNLESYLYSLASTPV